MDYQKQQAVAMKFFGVGKVLSLVPTQVEKFPALGNTALKET